jgi:L-threonylcarbamoyladenylate synthase
VVLAASAAAAGRVAGTLDGRQRAYAERCWPGPFSLVLPAGPMLPAAVTAGGGTVAVRVPGDPGLRDFLAAVGVPLASTSVNEAGGEPAATLDEAELRFGDRVDGVWLPSGTAAPAGPVAASAVVDLTVWPPRTLRPGPRELPPWDDLDGESGAV